MRAAVRSLLPVAKSLKVKTKKLIPLNHKTVLEEMKYLEECLQSAISYGGGLDVDDLRKVDYFVRRT